MIAVHVYASIALLVLAAWTLWNLARAMEAFHRFHALEYGRREREQDVMFAGALYVWSLSDGSRNDAGGRSQSPVVALKPPSSSFVGIAHGDAPRSTRADGVAVLHDRWVAEYAGEPLPPPVDRTFWPPQVSPLGLWGSRSGVAEDVQ